jgi:hypothetical protein
MIAIETEQGNRLKNLNAVAGTYVLHPVFGFVPESKMSDRSTRRKRHGLKVTAGSQPFCRFTLNMTADGFAVTSLNACEATQSSAAHWTLKTAQSEYRLKLASPNANWILPTPPPEEKKSDLVKYALLTMALLAVSIGTIILSLPKHAKTEPEVIAAPIQVTVVPETKIVQKSVTVPVSDILPQLNDVRLQDKVAKRAIQQNLGFLGMLGKKNLSKAAGGIPSTLADASPGAGPGGREGSGGELLVGLGQGVRKTTVGNTGVAGLGGVGTKGVGGGAGGYGNTLIGSGEGRALSNVAISNDMILEGGLDRAVIQATIAKYLSQVRNCYEEQLQGNPGLTGQVTMAFVINGGGNVAQASVQSSTLGNAKVESCISTKLKTWKFPQPVGGVNVKVNYPFLLRPVGT